MSSFFSKFHQRYTLIFLLKNCFQKKILHFFQIFTFFEINSNIFFLTKLLFFKKKLKKAKKYNFFNNLLLLNLKNKHLNSYQTILFDKIKELGKK